MDWAHNFLNFVDQLHPRKARKLIHRENFYVYGRFVFWSLNIGSSNNKGSTVYVIGSEKTCHVDNYFKIILFMINIQHLLIYRMHFILFYLNVQK